MAFFDRLIPVSPLRNCEAGFAVAVFFAAALACPPTGAQEASERKVFQTSRKAHRIEGWEQGLVKKSPNLGNYYWTPITEYTQNKGSRQTGKGARPSSSSAPTVRRYVKPHFAPLPVNDRAEFSASEMESRSDLKGKVRFPKAKDQLASGDQTNEEVSGVLTYGDGDGKGYGYSESSKKLSVSGKLYGQKKQ